MDPMWLLRYILILIQIYSYILRRTSVGHAYISISILILVCKDISSTVVIITFQLN